MSTTTAPLSEWCGCNEKLESGVQCPLDSLPCRCCDECRDVCTKLSDAVID